MEAHGILRLIVRSLIALSLQQFIIRMLMMITKEILDWITLSVMDDIVHIQDEDDVRILVDYILNLYEEVRDE